MENKLDLRAALKIGAGVVIECLDWSDFVTRYDGPETLFYLDPPYWGSETDYGKALFNRDDFVRMADLLAGIKGRWIMSINDVPEIRHFFARFEIAEVSTSYSIGNHAGRGIQRPELLISNIAISTP